MGLAYIVLHAHALLLGEVVGMVLEWMVKQQFNFFAQPECEMSSPFLVTLSNWLPPPVMSATGGGRANCKLTQTQLTKLGLDPNAYFGVLY